jgi:hypothetical protein
MTNRKLITELSIYLCCQKSEQKDANHQGVFFINLNPIYEERKENVCTFSAQSTLVNNMIPGCTASAPLNNLATFS